jgi:hypothetical protein
MAEANALSAAGPASRRIYHALLSALGPCGRFEQEVKTTSIHLVRASAFVGVHRENRVCFSPLKRPNLSAAPGSPRRSWFAKTAGTWR